MAGTYIFKPQTRKGPVFISPSNEGPPTITLANGRTITAVRADRAGGAFEGHEGFQWVFPNDILGQEGATLSIGGKTQKLGNTNMSYRGNSVGSLSESSKGAIGDVGTPVGQGAFQQVGEFGVAPNYIGDKFPTPELIAGAAKDYQYIDPIKFGREFTPYQRTQLQESFTQGGDFAMQALNTEFAGLASYATKASQLKKDIIAEDNIFNQEQRTAQVMAAVPDVAADLQTQAADARAYARGDLPDAQLNKSIELGLRSRSADLAASGGFGINSSAARKVSDLQSAEQRFQIAQYGNNLLSSNAAQRQQLFLAPTEYTNAGSQINVNPTVSASQLQQSNFGAINQAVNLPATQAFQNATQQSQFISELTQRTQEFNANNANNFALSFFNYLNSYTNALAGAGQTNINTNFSLEQQNDARSEAVKQRDRTQRNNTIGSVVQGAALIGSQIFSDKELKESIEPFVDPFDILDPLNVYTYTYKDESVADDSGKKHIGVLAQEFERVLPESVHRHESGYLQINPSELIFVLLEAARQLNKRLQVIEHGRLQ